MSLAKGQTDSESDFFDINKYKSAYWYFKKYQKVDLSDAGSAARKVQRLGKYLVDGFDALREGRADEALIQFKKSSGQVPEYFHPDFIIALTYEKKGDNENASRYYKSYLEKLKKYREGMYPLTSPIIEKTVSFTIPGYEWAEELIGQRMAAHGIDMRKVSTFRLSESFLIIIFAVAGVVILYLLAMLGPVRRIFYMLKALFNFNKETWICTRCGKKNANINVKCHGCGKNAPAGE
ncbi:hypothetical protein ACFLQ8_02100 [Candidatus Auribacterota bacterium]